MHKFFLERVIEFIIPFAAFIILFSFRDHPPFYCQPRPPLLPPASGKNNKIFKIIKFKTMSDKRNKQGNLLPDAERLTALGKFVRKTSLDEIPQLLNVIKGDMSINPHEIIF